jgi:hypothetical protein
MAVRSVQTQVLFVRELASARGYARKLCIARRYFLFGFQTVVLGLFVTLHSASLFAQQTNPDGKAEKLQPGQMPYFDAVPDRIEGFNRCSWAVNEWLFRGLICMASFPCEMAIYVEYSCY